MSQQTNAAQLKVLIEYMEKHDALATNSLQNVSNGREKKKYLWNKLTEMLNSNGPPTKTTKGWQKVWTDYKYNAKRRLSSRMNSLKKTGGGPYDAVQLSNMDERVIAAARINAQVTGIPGVASYGTEEDRPCSSASVQQRSEDFINESLRELLSGDDSSSNNNENIAPSETHSPSSNSAECVASQLITKQKRRCLDPKVKLIEEEIGKQGKFQTEIIKILKENNEIEKRKVQLMEQHIASEIQYKKMKLQVLEVNLEKVKCEIELLKQKTNAN